MKREPWQQTATVWNGQRDDESWIPKRLYTATARDKQRVVLVADDRALRRAEFHLSGRRRETTRSFHQLTLRNGALQMKKTLVNAAAAVALLACATAQAARFTDNSLDLAGTTLDGETGFMIGAEGRPKATTGLAFAGDYLSEDLFGVDRTRLRAGFGVGHFFGNERGHYAALLVGAVRDDLDIDDDAGWMVQARYEYSPTGPVSIGGNLTYADVWDGGASLDIYTRVHLSKYFAVQVGFTTDVIDEIEGDDRFYAGFRLSHDWL